MKTILITGATGFLGTSLVRRCIDLGHRVVGTGYSESGIKDFERRFKNYDNISLHAIDVSADRPMLKNIIDNYKVDFLIHGAALKHVGICESNPTRAVDVNVIGSKNIIDAAIDCKIKNAIAVSTDKSINPLCIYGMTKRLMEDMFLEHNFGVFQGINFLFSTESVLDIWEKLRKNNEPILVNMNAERYFAPIESVSAKIIDSIEIKERFTVDECYKISISNLQKAFSTYHNYWNVKEYTPLDVEKVEEELPLEDVKVLTPDIDSIVNLLSDHYKGIK